MNEYLKEYKNDIANLSIDEKKKRDLYLRKLALGEIEGPPTGYATIDKPFLKYYSEEVISSDLPQNTIYGYIKDRNMSELDRIAIDYYGNTLTYSELISKIDECARALYVNGVRRGDIVTICMPTTPETVFMFYALSKIGAVSNMIDPRKSAKEIEEYTAEVGSKIFMGVDLALGKLSNLKNNTDVDKIIIATPYESFKKPIKQVFNLKSRISNRKYGIDYLSWDEFIDTNRLINDVDEVIYDKNMPVTIVHTGGTTGRSKGVILSNDTINAGAYQCEICGLDFKDRGTWLDIMPPFIVYGVGNGLHLPLSMGMRVKIIPAFNPKDFAKILLKYNINYSAGVPSHFNYLIEDKRSQNADFSFWKTPIVGGDKMDYSLEKDASKFLTSHNGVPVIKGYGMSEVDAAVCVCAVDEVNKIGSVGIPLSHSNIGIFDPETGRECGYGEIGEIRIFGPNIMEGYYNNPLEQEKILHTYFNERVIYSGDLGYIDKDGCLFVIGRYKEMIIRPDGFKVYPSSIEEVILQHPDVSECKVVGCRDFTESQGELPMAFIKLKNKNRDQGEIKKEIEDICNKELAEYSLPFDYEMKDEFPVTSIGKIDTLELKREIEGRMRPVSRVLKK